MLCSEDEDYSSSAVNKIFILDPGYPKLDRVEKMFIAIVSKKTKHRLWATLPVPSEAGASNNIS